MKLKQAIQHFAHTSVDGWNQATGEWSLDIAKGNILTFDRFITERTFGQKKRIFQMAGETGLSATYEAIRDPAGNVYLVTAKNVDIAQDTVYNNIYLVQRADYTGEMLSMVTGTAASGTPMGNTPTVVATFPMDFDKLTSANSGEFDGVIYSGMIGVLPASVPITTDHEIRVDGITYDVLEVFLTINLKGIRINKRSAAA